MLTFLRVQTRKKEFGIWCQYYTPLKLQAYDGNMMEVESISDACSLWRAHTCGELNYSSDSLQLCWASEVIEAGIVCQSFSHRVRYTLLPALSSHVQCLCTPHPVSQYPTYSVSVGVCVCSDAGISSCLSYTTTCICMYIHVYALCPLARLHRECIYMYVHVRIYMYMHM